MSTTDMMSAVPLRWCVGGWCRVSRLSKTAEWEWLSDLGGNRVRMKLRQDCNFYKKVRTYFSEATFLQ